MQYQENGKKLIKSNIPITNLDNLKMPKDSIFLHSGNSKLINLLQNREIYIKILGPKYCEPTAVNAWIDLFPFLNDADWSKIFSLPFAIQKEPYLQTFQYKIINRLLNCNYNLKKWKLKPSNNCIYCAEIDTLEHHLFECSESQKIWKNLNKWMTQNLEFSFKFSICEIIFGLIGLNDENIKITNFLILITKFYINKNRTKEEPLYFFELLSVIRQKVLLNNFFQYTNEHFSDGNWLNRLLIAL